MGRDPLEPRNASTFATTPGDSERLIDGHNPVLAAADAFMGGFCILMLGIGLWSWQQGTATWVTPAAIFLFVAANAAVSQVSFRSRTPFRIEVARLVIGGLIAPGAFALVDGPLAPFWPGFLIMSLGGSIVLGLITQNPWFGRGLVGYYLALFALSTFVFHRDWPLGEVAMAGGVIAMAGLMFAQIMSLLGEKVRQVHTHTVELKEARDALFAEMEVAQEIQTLLLPKSPTMRDHEVVGRMIPADEVGGDYFDVIEIKETGRSLLAIGDVSGHGVTSGLTMMMARSSLVGALEASPRASLVDLFRALNRALFRNLERMSMSLYMTLTLLEYEGAGRFSAVGRHLPLLVFRKADGTVEELEVEGTWLGVANDLRTEDLPVRSFSLAEGDLVVMYTDGIVEHQGSDEMFGFDRLKQFIAGSGSQGPRAVLQGILDAVAQHGKVQDDDITLLVVTYSGEVHAPKI